MTNNKKQGSQVSKDTHSLAT